MIMLGLWFLRIKAIFSQILAFTIAHYRIILPCLILGYCLINWHFAVKRAEKAELALSDFKAAIQKETDTQRLQNELKKVQGENESKAIALEHKQALKKLGLADLDRKNLQNKLRAYQDETAHLKNRIDDTNANWSERMRIEANHHGARMPEEPENTNGLADARNDCDFAAYSKLEQHYYDLKQACQITTLDLGACIKTVDADTKACGREQ